MEEGLVEDAVISQNQGDVDAFWGVRDGMAESMGKQQPAVGFDVSLSIDDMDLR